MHNRVKPSRGDSLVERAIEALHHAAHYLPDQGPIGVFIHHNTLHAFEHLSFHEAIAQGTALFGTEPYMTEETFRRCHAEGRIETSDIDAAIAADCPDDAVLVTAAGRTLRRRELRRLAMLHPMAAETPEGLRYLLAEGALDTRLGADVPAAAASRIIEEGLRYARGLLGRDSDDDGVKALAAALAEPDDDADTARARLVALCHGALDRETMRRALERDPETFAVKALWARCRALTRSLPGTAPSPAARGFRLGPDGTHRDLLLHLTGEDTDRLVNPEMLRLASAFLDLGMAYWPMPDREQGFYAGVRALMADAPRPAAAWLRAAANELRARARRGDQASDVIVASLAELGVPEDRLGDYFTRLLRAQPGWAGMMSRLERHPEDRPSDSPPASLADFTAVRMIFERAAIRHVARTALGWRGPLAELVDRFGREVSIPAPAAGDHDRAYRLFRLLSVAGIAAGTTDLGTASAGTLIAELEAFDELARRRTFHEAYERYHRRQILDALAEHRQHVRVGRPVDVPRFQAIMCIDEREESLRRHLEEIEPGIETFGAAGFFGVAMDFRGMDDAHHVPLCPVVQTPAHEVEEHPHDEDVPMFERRVARRRLWARFTHSMSVGSRSLVRGHVLTALGGAAAIPLTTRVLFPRATGRLRRRVAEMLLPRPRTMLRSVREGDEAAAQSERGKLLGFSLIEKVDRATSMLQGLGLVEKFAPLIVVLGHGSTSLNNPHESAHDCGACGGRRGGPNARLFAEMLNRPEVREGLRARGIDVPDSTWFIGGMHDTASDAIPLYDLDRVPAHATQALQELKRVLDRARALDAHERCRRFEAAPRDGTPEQALRHVEARSEHLAEPRPEYGHATNAVCIVGRRSLTRGLFLDRRAFLVSYDPTRDPDTRVLERTLAAVGPVGAGINLEYYFSFVDNERYGCGTKLPHNITGLLGVMNGHASDLRTGLPWQMVEVHEPVRLLTIVEATPEQLLIVAERQPVVRELVVKRWIQLVSVDPETGAMKIFGDQGFVPYAPDVKPLPVVRSSMDWYRGHLEHLAPARIDPREKAMTHAAR
jgi:uncharacterized protein YbcC (UPF0753/DUF2309 family)